MTNMNGGYLCAPKQCNQNSGAKPCVKLIKLQKSSANYKQTFNLIWLRVAWGLFWNNIYWFCYIFRTLWGWENFWELMWVFCCWFLLFFSFAYSEQLWMVLNIEIYQRADSSLKTFFLGHKLDSHASKNQTFLLWDISHDLFSWKLEILG